MPPVTVFTPGRFCGGCKLTKMHLAKAGIEFVEKPIEQAGKLAEGKMSAPIVQAGNQVWDGYRPDRIDALRSLATV